MQEEISLTEEHIVDEDVELVQSDEPWIPRKKSSLAKRILPRLCLCLCVVFLMVGLGVLCFSLGFLSNSHREPKYVYYDPDEYILNRKEGSDEKDILETREFQIRLDYKTFKDRWAAVNEMKEKIRLLMGEELPNDMWETQIYSERQLNTKKCGHRFSELRLRHFYNESGIIIQDKSTIDINEDNDDKMKALAIDLRPNEDVRHFERKVEQDIHETHRKYNIKTKIKKLNNAVSLTECNEVLEFFPKAFDGHAFSSGDLKYGSTDDFIWQHSFQSDSFFFGSAKMKLSFTLYFDSLEDSLNENKTPTKESEFSMRLYSPGEGNAPWHFEALEYAADVFTHLI